MNDAVATQEARRLAMQLAVHCKEYAYLLPLDIPFPGLKVTVSVERIRSEADTLPLGVRAVEDELE